MEMVAAERIEAGIDLTPPLSPISYSLHDSHYFSSSSSLLLHFMFILHQSHHRLHGLMTNHHNLLTITSIKNDAMTIAKAEDITLQEAEAVLCAVLTNAVEVQDRTGRSVGIAVYDTTFSWINHSCSPNACYRFLPPETPSGGQRCLIVPVCSEPFVDSELLTGSGGGPRIVVRSIKPVKKGEPVTISYTDLLQPKELRQSELWSKYRFTCCCHRCVACPLTYVDHRLQETCGCNNEFLTEYIDDAIDDYLLYNDADSCCKKLEDALLNHELRLHPQNHLCLNAHTTLASAYSSASATAMEDEDGLKMKRFSVAYSLLLALLTQDLYLHESSLVVSVSNFWVGAGESLINLSKWLVSSGSSKLVLKCECGLIDVFEEANFEVLKEKVFKCMIDVIRGVNVWKFLVVGNAYLEIVNDLIDLVSNVCDYQDVFGLGAHCLLFGGILSNVSGGHNSHLSCYVRQLLGLKTLFYLESTIELLTMKSAFAATGIWIISGIMSSGINFSLPDTALPSHTLSPICRLVAASNSYRALVQKNYVSVSAERRDIHCD
ncbi:protein SET DOMAIN GROUP 41-like [Bidens hawaiensis]|uniref:protein SET DOMAIN GROUP 41-like n=1 Tax=Bidens hawaiensis TaxID=980011 RepID=UPI00404A7EF8